MPDGPNLAVLSEAANNLDWLEPRVRGLLALAGELRRLGGLANALREIEARLRKVRDDDEKHAAEGEWARAQIESARTARLNEIAAEVARLRAETDQEITVKHASADTQIAARHQEMEAEYVRVINEAETEAKRVLDDAVARAREIVSDAHTSVAEQTRQSAEHAQKVEEHRATLADIRDHIDDAVATRDTLEAEAKVAEQRRDDANAAYQAFRDALPV